MDTSSALIPVFDWAVKPQHKDLKGPDSMTYI